MTDLDQWLGDAAAATDTGLSADALRDLELRLDGEPVPQSLSTKRDTRRMMLCASLAALVGFTVTGVTGAFAESSPTWIAAPSSSSPFNLLVGN